MSGAYHYRVASYLNNHPEELEEFFSKRDALEIFANIYGMLKQDVRGVAVKIASRLIVKVARRIADTGYRCGPLKTLNGYLEGAELALEASFEKYLDAPEKGIIDNLVSYGRERQKHAFVMILDRSYSMKGIKIVLAGITAASIAQHFKHDYAVLAFSNDVTVLKRIDETVGPDRLVERLFGLELYGDTNTCLGLKSGFNLMDGFKVRKGLLLTDGAWNRGGSPLPAAARFDMLSVIGFPPARRSKIRSLAVKSGGRFAFVENENEIAAAIMKCLH